MLRLTSRKPLWLDLQPVDIKSRWRHNWKSAKVVNCHLVCDSTIRQPGFDLPQQQWSLLNHFHTEQGHCSAWRRKWRLTDTDLCTCGETMTMSTHCRILSSDKVEWRLIPATLCRWRCCFLAGQYCLWHSCEKKNGADAWCHKLTPPLKLVDDTRHSTSLLFVPNVEGGHVTQTMPLLGFGLVLANAYKRTKHEACMLYHCRCWVVRNYLYFH